ncbi:hypothetical protein DY218_02950 [Streptomyces triticagri]|uniref:Uncharacterized protein n=1 Tax=Streptomyces triticagri TaxID=2293568 RepID=A0A372MCY7_9ACTN|nr:hypothetical protein [Streptomyces triticagri]RFU88253.1 hypothetical protein DY218_02950 [Streptomyces triticagri]
MGSPYSTPSTSSIDSVYHFAVDTVYVALESLPTHVHAAVGVTGTPEGPFDTVVMGRGTYEPGLKEVRALKAEQGGGIWLAGDSPPHSCRRSTA